MRIRSSPCMRICVRPRVKGQTLRTQSLRSPGLSGSTCRGCWPIAGITFRKRRGCWGFTGGPCSGSWISIRREGERVAPKAAILIGTMLFEVKGLSKRFGRIAALADVSFHVRAGEVLGLIGPNGAGKSTLFECLAGVLPSDRGEVLTGGRPVRELLFYVPDGIAPWPAQSVRWALEFTIGF